jgi:hypothetical protein
MMGFRRVFYLAVFLNPIFESLCIPFAVFSKSRPMTRDYEENYIAYRQVAPNSTRSFNFTET